VKKFENRLIFVKDMDSYKVGRFLRHSVISRLHAEAGWTSQLIERSSSQLDECFQYQTCLITQAPIKLLRQAFITHSPSRHQAS